jgi:REP element-mobilizing transposase RayT
MSERYKFADREGVYFVTPTITAWADLFTKKQYCDIVLNSLKYCQQNKGLVIHAWCIMSSHLHLIVSTKQDPLANIMRDFKKFTSKAIIDELENGTDSRKEWLLKMFADEAAQTKRGKYYKVWQDGNHPVLLDTNLMVERRLDYLHSNPVEHGHVAVETDYYYSSARDYAGNGDGLLNLEMLE